MAFETQIFVFFQRPSSYVAPAHLLIKPSWEANFWFLVCNFIKEIFLKIDFIEEVNFKRWAIFKSDWKKIAILVPFGSHITHFWSHLKKLNCSASLYQNTITRYYFLVTFQSDLSMES